MAYIPQVVGNFTLSAETLTAIGEDIGVGVTVVADSLETLHAYGNVVTTNYRFPGNSTSDGTHIFK